MKITCNTRNLNSKLTGVQRYTFELTRRLQKEINVVTPSKNVAGITGHLWEQLILPSQLSDSLLWSPSNTGPITVENQVVTIHDMSMIDHPEWSNWKFSAWYNFLIPKLVKKVKAIIAVSEFTKERIIYHYPNAEEKISVVYNGVDERFHPLRLVKSASKPHELKLPSPHYFLTMGSIEPRKNIHRLLQAWSTIYKNLPEDIWLVVGGRKGGSNIFADTKFSNIPPRVFFVGEVSELELTALYSNCIASIYISLYEGFGLPPLEAMACGAPVIVSNTTSLPEVVGDSGVLVDPLDVDDISNGMLKIVDNIELRSSLSESGIKRASLFSWDKAAENTLQILKEAAFKM